MSEKEFKLPPYVPEASCLQFCIVRPIMSFIYGIFSFFVIILYSIIIGITSIINNITVCCAKHKFEAHYKNVTKLALWNAHMSMYLLMATDESPDLCP